MNKQCINGIICSEMDGIKDAEKHYNYAITAKEEGNKELARMHIEEAMRRLDGVKDWHKRTETMVEWEKNSVTEAIKEKGKEHYIDLMEKVRNFTI